MEKNLLPELELLARSIDGQGDDIRELFQYALVLLLIEDHRAEIVEGYSADGHAQLVVRTNTGELFSVVKPDVSAGEIGRIQEKVRESLAETGEDASGAKRS